MEAFEHVVKVYLEAQGYVVTSGVKFPVAKLITKRSGRKERQTHGYEVDLVGARRDSLLLCSVKSFFGSAGVHRQGFEGLADERKKNHFGLYRMFNDKRVRNGIIRGASERFRYPTKRISLVLFAGKFHSGDEEDIRRHLAGVHRKGGGVRVVGLQELVATLLSVSERRTYINDPVVMTLKVLHAAGVLTQDERKSAGGDARADVRAAGHVRT